MKKYLIIPFVILFLSGCATTAKYQTALQSWHGKSVQQLVSNQGYPDTTFKTSSGNTVYVYHKYDQVTFPDTIGASNTFVSTKQGQPIVVTPVPGNRSNAKTYYYNC